MSDFAAKVKDWADKRKKNQVYIFRSAAQKLVDAMLLSKFSGGNMPIDTGNLRRSLLASTSYMPVMIADGYAGFKDNGGQIALIIAGAEINNTLYFGFQAPYARRMEYGFTGEDALGRYYNQSGNGFVRLAADRWQTFVDEAIKEIEG